MFSRSWQFAMVFALSGAVLVSCRSVKSRHPVVPGVPANPVLGPAETGDGQVAKLARGHAHYAAGVIAEMDGDTAAALDEYYQAAEADPGNEELVLAVSRRLLQHKQPQKALELLDHAAALPQASGALWAGLGVIYAELGRTDQAIAADRTAIRKAPRSLLGYRNLSLALIQSNRSQEALAALDEAGGQSKPDAEFLAGLSELYASLGLQVPSLRTNANEKALGALNRAAKLNPKSPALRLLLADGFNLLGATGKAEQLYLGLVSGPGDATSMPELRQRVRSKLAEIYLGQKDYRHAGLQLEAMLRDDPTNPGALYYLGTIAFEQKKSAEAIEYFRKTILLNPDFERAYYDLASAQINLGKAAEALATLDKARQRWPQSFLLEFLAGLALSREEAYAQALDHFTAAEIIAQATDPKRLNEFFYFQLGATCERKGDYAQAEKWFEKCLQVAPDFAEALNYLGYMWAEHDMKLLEARALIERALKAEPKNAAYLDSLGWVLFKLNQPREALDCVLKAAKLIEEPDPSVFDHLGDIYAALRQPEKAREAWRKSLAIKSDDQVRKKLDAPPSRDEQHTNAEAHGRSK
jgi:tetratricopeptide (TPR) repeat protein